jgi:hypothetical protein
VTDMPRGIDSKHMSIYERRWDAILMGLGNGTLQLGADAAKDPTRSNARFYAGDTRAPWGATPYFTRNTLDTTSQ